MRRLAPIAMFAGLAACSGGSATMPIVTDATFRPKPDTSDNFQAPQVSREAGLQDIIGARAHVLLSRFGKPRIDLAEGDARKLQFASTKCVLDIYLYPLQAGSEPVATHVETRLREDAGQIDKSRCLNQIAGR